MKDKFQNAMAWLKVFGTTMIIVAEAGQRIASTVDAAGKASA